MSRRIYVQAQADHIESLSKAAPLSAIEELVWNALDADVKSRLRRASLRKIATRTFSSWVAKVA